MRLLALVTSLLFVCTSSFSQTAFKRFEVTIKGKPQVRYACILQLKDGMGKPDSVKVDVLGAIIDSLHWSDSLVLSVLQETSNKARGTLKERISYEINHMEQPIAYYVDNTVTVVWYYIGQNAYGAKKSSECFVNFKPDGSYDSIIPLSN